MDSTPGGTVGGVGAGPLQGSVIEIGAGPGSCFPLYPPAVTHVLALEPDDYLRGVAREQAALASVPVTLVAAAAENIRAETGSADANPPLAHILGAATSPGPA